MTTTEDRRRALLDRLLTAPPAPVRTPSAIPTISRDHALPLSSLQRQLWFLDQLRPGAAEYVMPFAWRLTGALDTSALRAALTEIVARHEILRTRYRTEAGEPVQIVDPPATITLTEVDLSGQEARFEQLCTEQATRPFDLAEEAPARWVLARLGDDTYALLLSVHHIAFDGSSAAVLVRELGVLYPAYAEGRPSALPPIAVQYADFAAWQRDRAADRDLTYWRERLADLAPLELPTDRPRPPVHDPRGATVRFTVPAGQAAALHTLARTHRVTPFMVFLAAFQVLLARYSGQSDVAVGSPVAGRGRPELRDLIGYFVNTLVLRADLAADPSFARLLTQVREHTLGAFEHQDLPFERLVDELAPERDPSRNPLFTTMFVLQNTEQAHVTAGGVRAEPLPVAWHSAKFDLTLYLTEQPGGSLAGVVEYATALFDRGTAERVAANFTQLLDSVVANPDAPVSTLELMPAAARHQLVVEWNDTEAAYPTGTLPELFAAQVARTPDALAVRFADEIVTYAELDRRANRLAHHLVAQGVGPESVIGVCLHRSVDLVAALLAVHKAGGAYLPLDPDHPAERLAFLRADSGATTVITPATFDGLAGPDHDPGVSVRPEHPAYVIYTSGSTGRPKGVVIEHRGIVNRLRWMQDAYRLDATDRVLQKTPSTFDVSVWEFFWPLVTGAAIVVAEPDGHRDPVYLAELIRTTEVTTVHFVPSMLRAFLTEPFGELPSLRRMICSGEALPSDLVTAVHDRIRCPLHNLYGPTEASVDVTAIECVPDQPVTIGRPIANTRTYVVDAGLRPTPVGVPGELMLAGVQLARGYLNRPDLTAARFVPDPFGPPGERLYRTGDLARFRPDGTIEYLGRVDHQVKIRGQRIELGEIEAVLTEHPEVTAAAVIVHNGQLAAYLAPAGVDAEQFLRDRLPDAMIPAYWTTLAELPLTTSGKVDRKALPAPDGHRPPAGHTVPTTPLEHVIAQAMAEAIGVDRVGVHDRFFRIGGDSIRAVRVVGNLREQGLDLSVQDVFRHQTVAELAAAVAPRPGGAPDRRVAPFELVGQADRDRLPAGLVDAYPLSMVQAGMVYEMRADPGRGLYLNRLSYPIRDDAPLSLPALHEAARLLVRRHEILRTSIDVDGYSQPLQLVHADSDITVTLGEPPATTPDLGTPSLLSLHATPLDGHDWRLTIVYCHPILDGWSQNSLVPELLDHYRALRDGRDPAPAPPPAVRFADSVALELAAVESGADRAFWASRVTAERLSIPGGWATGDPAWHAVRVRFDDLTPGLREVAAAADVPLKSVLLAAHLIVLRLVSGRRRFHTGLVCNGRPELAGGDQVRGMFLNTVPFGVDLGQRTWTDLARAVFAEEIALWPHRHFPLPAMQREWGKGTPLVDVFFNHTDMHVLAGGQIDVAGIADTTPNEFGLSVSTEPGTLVLESGGDRIGPARLDLLAATYRQVLEAVVAGSDPRRCRLPDAERTALLTRWNATTADIPAGTLPELFAARAAATPDALAVVAGAERMTYAELDARTNQVAHHLRERGVRPGTLVGLRLARGMDLLVAFLAVLKAGGAYVPLDPDYPEQRIRFMLDDAGTRLAITDPAELPADGPTTPVPRLHTQDDLAYVIYTSGSTGTPKGVLIHHRGLTNFLTSVSRRPGLAAGDTVIGLTTVSFDPSVLELFLPLVVGAHVVLANAEQARDPHRMAALIDGWAPQVLQATPVTLRMLLDSGWAAPRGLTILCGGEKLPTSLAVRLAAHGATVWDLYGPTETTVWATTARLDAGGAVVDWAAEANSTVHLLDADLEPVPVGVVGEVYIGGTGVAWGYHGRPDLTAATFVPDPYTPGARLYRTGDLARRGPDGAVEILGRADHQMKIRGHRIEPGEIEGALLAHPSVRAAVVHAMSDQLVAYVVPGDGQAPTAEELRDLLLRALPDYMVPAAFVTLAEFPLTPTGKVDRRALPAPTASASEPVSPRTPAEHAVAAAWREVLGREEIGIHENFFDAGGHSLLATRVAVRLRATQCVDVPVRALFDHATVAALAAALPSYPKAAAPPTLTSRRGNRGVR